MLLWKRSERRENPLQKRKYRCCNFTFWDHITDQTGLYFNEDGTPYTYIGHWAWIPMLNNQCKLDFDGQPVICGGKRVAVIDWIAQQRLEEQI